MPEHNYKFFFDQSKDLLCIANSDGYLIDVNHSFCDVLGYTKAVLLEKPYISFVHPSDIEKTIQELERLDTDHESTNFENRYRTQSGSYVVLSWSSTRDPKTGRIIASARDITAYSNKAHKLQQLEAAMNAKAIMAETDKKGVISRVNDRFCEISGYSREEMIGNSHSAVNSGLHSKAFFQNIWRTISNKEVWSGDITNRKKNGDLYYVKTTIIPLTDLEDEIFSYLVYRQDITDKVHNAMDLAKTLQILNETSALAKVGGWELDVATGVLTCTDETFQIFEVDQEEGLPRTLPDGIDLYTPECSSIIDEAIKHCLATGEPYSLELMANTLKGNTLWVHTEGKANYVDGKIVTLSGTIQDIDAKKKSEKKYNLERQKSIQNARLASLGELAASMAHEINNPLGIISGYSELLLRDQAGDTRAKSKIEVILKSCGRISHIVNNLKKFSRAEREQKQKSIVLSDLINESIMLAQPNLKRCIIDLQFEIESEAHIVGNVIEIEQVFLNLINNSADAIKDLPKKWIKIELSVTTDSVIVRIIDSGDGITKDELRNIFSPFYTSKKVGEGTGLGLSIVDGILKDHDAKIEYDGTSDNTCFVLTFKRDKDC